MRRILAKVICLAMLLSALAIPAALSASTSKLVLPAQLTVVDEESFTNDTSLTEVEIPETVQSIGAKAFSGCSGLKKVSIFSRNAQIATNAFERCPNITLYVYSDSTAEAFAREAGISYVLLDSDDRPTYLKVKEMIGQFSASGTGLMGGGDRIIVKMYGVALPDISTYNPVTIIEDDRDTYFIQFESENEASACRAMLDSRSDCAFAEFDHVGYVDNRGEDTGTVSAAGILTWQNDDDPMGFDVYAPFVASHQSGSQTIAIIDTGVEYNAVYSSMLSPKSINMLDDGQDAFYSGRHHATHIAGIIHDCVGNTNVKILSIRAVDDNERTDSILFGQSIAYAVDSGADIINISYLFPKSSYVEDEIRYAVSKGVKVIIAAGNENGSTSEVFPANANVDDLIVVSGLDDGNKLWSHTNTGSEVTFCAPASGIRTSVGDVGNGTSFAAPMIASAYALVSLDTTHTIKDMRNSCKTDISVGNKTQALGYGMPQLHKLAPLKVTEITVTNAPSTLKVGETYDLAYTVKPDKALDRSITPTSDNTSALTLTKGTGESLVLKGEGKGKSTVTLTANDGSGVSTRFDVQVVQPVTRITISADSLETDLQHTLPLKLSVEPSDADNKEVTWTSSMESVATVSQTGVVTPVSEGITVIRAEAKDGDGASDQVTVKVVDIPDPVSITIFAQGNLLTRKQVLEVNPNETIRMKAEVYPENAVQDVTWDVMSIPEGAVTIDSNGLLKTFEAGTAFVTATSTVKPSVKQEAGIVVRVLPTEIKLNGPGEVKVGESITLEAVVLPDNATNKKVTWDTSDHSIATVDQNGKVTGKYGSEVEIIATSVADPNLKGSKMIVVKQLPESVTVTGDLNLIIDNGNTSSPAQTASQMTATVSPANAYDRSVTWSSDNTSVAVVDASGIVTTVAPGTAHITATCKADSSIKDTVTVTVIYKWGNWSSASTTPVTASNDRQVESWTEYRSRTLGAWSGWSGWDENRQSIPDAETKQEDSATVYYWYRYVCPHCGTYMHVYNKCYTWAGGCGNTIGSTNYQVCWLTTPPGSGTQNWEGTGRIMLGSGPKDRWFYWVDASQGYPNGKSATGYRYRTRSDSGFSGWSKTPVEPVNTNDRKVIVETRTMYRYRIQNSFNENYSWGDWSEWSPTQLTADDYRQVESRTEYSSRTLGAWSGWSAWSDVRQNIPDAETKREESATIYYWYRFVCPYCGTHMHVYDKCHTWAGGCGRYIGSEAWQVCWSTTAPGSGIQNWEGTGRIMTGNGPKDRWFYWKDSSQGYPNGKSATGYRYKTRSDSGYSEWTTTPVTPVDTNDRKVIVRTRTTYRYRLRTSD